MIKPRSEWASRAVYEIEKNGIYIGRVWGDDRWPFRDDLGADWLIVKTWIPNSK